jgi:hypothetical protein
LKQLLRAAGLDRAKLLPVGGTPWLVKSEDERPVAIPPAFQADPAAVGMITGNPLPEKNLTTSV